MDSLLLEKVYMPNIFAFGRSLVHPETNNRKTYNITYTSVLISDGPWWPCFIRYHGFKECLPRGRKGVTQSALEEVLNWFLPISLLIGMEQHMMSEFWVIP